MAKTTKTPQQPGRDIVVELTVELIGVSLITLLAGVNPQLGRVAVIVMVGFLVGWLLYKANESALSGWVAKA